MKKRVSHRSAARNDSDDRSWGRKKIVALDILRMVIVTTLVLSVLHFYQPSSDNYLLLRYAQEIIEENNSQALDKTVSLNQQQNQNQQNQQQQHKENAIRKEKEIASMIQLEQAIANYKHDIPEDCKGKERVILVYLLFGQKIPNNFCTSLPTWDAIEAMIGPGPVFVKNCGNISDATPQKVYHHRPTTTIKLSALPSTGIGLLKRVVTSNFEYVPIDHTGNPMGESLSRRDVMWNILPNDRNYFRIILVKDPYFWIQSLCLDNPEMLKFDGSPCPSKSNGAVVPLTVHSVGDDGGEDEDFYPSAFEYWSKWIAGFTIDDEPDGDIESENPYMVIRYEDLLFHPDKVVAELSKCSGLPPNSETLQIDFSISQRELQRFKRRPTSGLLDRLVQLAMPVYSSHAKRTFEMSDAYKKNVQGNIDKRVMNMLG
eukprot:CAMPEP_0198153228 /NCGR_PEP_ID=MMETSP1443-20131203/63246_1 /TAXON_ID=186043 /ORGANISM="Entomoneis sp., Strain CCMP2396" /LENGTH=428 /DNA_ID=CAMNT_0043819485 /DNA_START=124 /DNA_END=1407 /DNA_ORIENTATION=+